MLTSQSRIFAVVSSMTDILCDNVSTSGFHSMLVPHSKADLKLGMRLLDISHTHLKLVCRSYSSKGKDDDGKGQEEARRVRTGVGLISGRSCELRRYPFPPQPNSPLCRRRSRPSMVSRPTMHILTVYLGRRARKVLRTPSPKGTSPPPALAHHLHTHPDRRPPVQGN